MIRFALLVCLLFPSSFPVKLPRSTGEGTEMSKMLAIDFEVFGVVQGVFFRKVSKSCKSAFVRTLDDHHPTILRLPETMEMRLMEDLDLKLVAHDISRMSDIPLFSTLSIANMNYTQKRGKELGLKGWCMNTPNGTVVGHLEGEKAKVEEMKQWLRHTGSPQSQIDKAEFHNEREISQPSFTNFEIRK